MRKKLFAAVGILLLLSVVGFAEIDVKRDTEGVNLIYDPGTGNLNLVTMGTNDRTVATLEIISENGWFVGETPPTHIGLFDIYNEKKSFKLAPEGFREIAPFGNLGPGRSVSEIAADLSVDGAAVLGGSLEQVFGSAHLSFVPEPNCSAMLGVAILGLLRFRRK